MRIGVIGGGSFGTAMAKLLPDVDHQVTLWFRNSALAKAVAEQRENQVYLPGFQLRSRTSGRCTQASGADEVNRGLS